MNPAQVQRQQPSPRFVRFWARIALLTLLLQLSSLGHWNLGPFHPGAQDTATHTQHCHGDTSSCGGQPTFVGTYIERPLTVLAPLTTSEIAREAPPTAQGAALPLPDQPPWSA